MSDKPDSTARVFFALWPNAAERAALAGWQPPLRELCGGRAMLAANLHNTLVFIGNIAEHRLEALKLAAQEVEAERFKLRFDLARYWGHNHIVFAAPHSAPPQLAQLVHDLEQHLERHRFRFDRRDYKPHITLLRHAKWSDSPLPEMPAVPWPVHDFVLVQSPQQEGDSHYRVLARFPLTPRP
ncbi:RNA 2',3'-cyclic phosphodiesterase [Ferrigenium kumadai]|uniref:RNA 2',3'-cyclic phosphodiesterase n=1 Tax=Ferrigenium kumadai TaxID=1682490 RepID=A0AAN1T1N7_9PROT|nr:RNA 2',3'-cyclic phosphodiesterase [Ferrigenium kumadai]BBJ00411.1 RNA 2',3'-cyclic phosphodiesterase [Ferrigenium kumadai]